MDQNLSLAEGLAPFANQLRQRYPVVQPVSQVLLKLKGTDILNTIEVARHCVLAWMSNRAGGRIPSEAWTGTSFDLQEVGAQRAAAVGLDDPIYWTARLDDADKNVPRRSWIFEVGLAARGSDEVFFACRLQCATRGQNQLFAPTVPGLIRQVIDSCDTELDGRALSENCWIIDNHEEVKSLVDLICDSERKRIVYVFSLPEGSENTDETAVPVADVLRSTLGAAHVAVITSPASYHLTDLVGKEFSVFNQAVRTYKTKLSLESDQPFDHPLALPARISAWPSGGRSAFANLLIYQALRQTVSGSDLENDLPSFTRVQNFAAEIRREKAQKAGASDRELLNLALEESEKLKDANAEQVETLEGLLAIAEGERDDLGSREKEARSELADMRARIAFLENATQNRSNFENDDQLPDSLEGLDVWAQKHLSGSVRILNRAIRAARKSDFQDVKLAYKALLLLKEHYVPMRQFGGIDRKQAFEQACQHLGLEESATFSGTRAGEYGDTYFVRFGGRRCELERHLKGKNTRDSRYAFRLYFFWDDESLQVIVGWLPSHLQTRIT